MTLSDWVSQNCKFASRRKVVLLTGFEDEKAIGKNPSWQAASSLKGRTIGGFAVEARQLPALFGRASEALLEAVRELRPDAVVCMGWTPDNEIKIETVARNLYDIKLTDEAGDHPPGPKVQEGGEPQWKATLPVDKILKAIRDAGFAVKRSDDAGGHTCNECLYNLLSSKGCPRIVGFVHIPKKYKIESLRKIAEAIVLTLS